MKEEFLHFVWNTRRFNQRNLKTIDGQSVEILNYGKLNYYDGPDFLEAKVKIGDIVWIGNIEIHVMTSDWLKHNHSFDPQYKNVILHVVYKHDKDLPDLNIPTLELDGLIPKSIYDRYTVLIQSKSQLPCRHFISDIDEELIQMYYQRLAIERLQEKSRKIDILLSGTNNNFEQVSFILLSKYFGLGSNSDSFQELANRISVQWLSKIRHEPEGISALMLGSAGFLDQIDESEDYIRHLKNTFNHYRGKWKIQSLESQWWKWKIGRPSSFPSLRLAQLAQLLTHVNSVFEMILDVEYFKKQLKSISLPHFWDNHYHFKNISVVKEKNISDSFMDKLIINVTIPMMFAYGKFIGEYEWYDRALNILENVKPEQNRITKMMSNSGLKNNNALNSQALLHLKTEYCDLKKCLNCQIGNHILQSNIYNLNCSNQDTVQEAYI